MLLTLLKQVAFPFYKTKFSHPIPRRNPTRPLQKPFKKWKIVKGDLVMVRAGDDKGKIGKIVKVLRKLNRVVVKGVNIRQYTKQLQDKRVRLKKSSSIHISNVGLYDDSVNKPVRVTIGYHPKSGAQLRISKKSGRILYKRGVENFKRVRRGKNRKLGIKDTPATLAHKVTYQGEDLDAIKREFEQFISKKEEREKNLVFSE